MFHEALIKPAHLTVRRASRCAYHSFLPPFMRAKLLQSCLTLWDPMACSPLGFSVHGILQASTCRRLLCPPPGDLPKPGIEPASLLSPALAGGFFTTSTTWEGPLPSRLPVKTSSLGSGLRTKLGCPGIQDILGSGRLRLAWGETAVGRGLGDTLPAGKPHRTLGWPSTWPRSVQTRQSLAGPSHAVSSAPTISDASETSAVPLLS